MGCHAIAMPFPNSFNALASKTLHASFAPGWAEEFAGVTTVSTATYVKQGRWGAPSLGRGGGSDECFVPASYGSRAPAPADGNEMEIRMDIYIIHTL